MGYGIDVCSYQGVIDWGKVYQDGIRFAILKPTYKNNSKESAFETNYAGCIKNGIKVGTYRYVYATTVAQAKAEANALVNKMKGKDIVCGVWLDMEDSSIKSLGKSTLTTIINTEATILKNAGYAVGIYCNKDWYYNVLDYTVLAKIYKFWIARYPGTDTGEMTESLSPNEYASAWQYSQCGKISGISTNVDRNYSFTDLSVLMGHTKATTRKLKARSNMRSTYKTKGYFTKGTKVKVLGTSKGKGFCKVKGTIAGKEITCYALRKYLE